MKDFKLPFWVKTMLFLAFVSLLPFLALGAILGLPLYFYSMVLDSRAKAGELTYAHEKLLFDKEKYQDEKELNEYRKSQQENWVVINKN